MKLIYELENIDNTLRVRIKEQTEAILFSTGDYNTMDIGLKAHSSFPWTQANPWELHKDSDFDGISDAFDIFDGPGAIGK